MAGGRSDVALVAHPTFDYVNRPRNFLAASSRATNLARPNASWANSVLALRQGNGQASKVVARRAAAEVRLPCMLYAAVGAFTGDAGEDTQLAIAQIRKMHGVLHVIRYEGAVSMAGPASSAGIAVVTRGYWFSRQALARLMAQCGGAVGMFDWNSQFEASEADARVTRGTAQFVDGHLHLWLASMDPTRSRSSAALIANVGQDVVDLRVVGQPQSEAGRNVLVAAVALARALQPSPVQVIVAQELEHRSDSSASRGSLSALPAVSALRTSAGARDRAA